MNVCPADKVQAPVELIWELLMQPAGYGQFWDMTVDRVDPVGAAVAGQRFSARTRALCRRWPIEAEVLEVDAARHQIRFRMALPCGVLGDNRISCTPLDASSCVLRYG